MIVNIQRKFERRGDNFFLHQQSFLLRAKRIFVCIFVKNEELCYDD